MSATLDTLRLAKRFREAGAIEPLAETIADALRETHEQHLSALVTKADLKADLAATQSAIEVKLSELRGEMTLMKWMLGFNLALSVAVLLKLLVP